MIKGVDTILIGSQNATKLAKFYKDTVGLKETMSFELGDNNEKGFMFEMKDSADIVIMDHSKVKGKSKESERIILNLEVDDIEKEVARMKKAKAKLIRDTYHIQDYGLIATFEDPDGNYFQFVQIRELN